MTLWWPINRERARAGGSWAKGEACFENGSNRKNIHSRAYKKRQLECQNEGMDHEECLKEARLAAKVAVQKAMDDGILEDPTEVD